MKEFSLHCALRASLAIVTVAAILLPASCSGGSDTSQPPAARLVGSSGGKLAVTTGVLAGTSLEIPSGAIEEDVTITIELGQSRPSPGYGAIGPAAKIGPGGVSFAGGATLVMPYDTTGILPGTPLEKFSIKIWDGEKITDLRALGVDRVEGRVTVSISRVCTAWVSFHGRAAPTPFLDYWPMNPGDSYDYDDATTLRIRDSDRILAGQQERSTELAWTDGQKAWGYKWMLSGGGDLSWLSQYGMNGDDRRRSYEPQLLCPKLMSVGTKVERSFPFIYFRATGQSAGTYYGDELTRFEVVEQLPEFTVPLGTFRDVLLVRLHSIVGLGVRVQTTKFWLARNIGPIQVEIDGGVATVLINARVGGQQIRPN